MGAYLEGFGDKWTTIVTTAFIQSLEVHSITWYTFHTNVFIKIRAVVYFYLLHMFIVILYIAKWLKTLRWKGLKPITTYYSTNLM